MPVAFAFSRDDCGVSEDVAFTAARRFEDMRGRNATPNAQDVVHPRSGKEELVGKEDLIKGGTVRSNISKSVTRGASDLLREGWTKETRQRKTGKSAGHFDLYWLSPKTKTRFRSLKKARQFWEIMVSVDNDEIKAC
uniref:MBD domain-containing protein n=1 Tax=Proboscia inermis TaxID=420281 RepID=A0A7S0C6W9_9STRA|mmetsp:Transcript_3102/g.3116  ORF Transcript_3102/g.3116 Transcript_3102/m.3116 type:complete len:137 (+) Transcript_3102:63-473(+)